MFFDTGWICHSPLSSQLLLTIQKLLWRTHASAASSTCLFVFVMTLILLILITRKALHQRTMSLRHYLDPLARFSRRSSNRPTYVLHVKCRISVREIDIVHNAVFFTTLRAPASRSRNPQASALSYANAVYSAKMALSLPHIRQQHLRCTSICRTSRNSGLAPPDAWTTVTS